MEVPHLVFKNDDLVNEENGLAGVVAYMRIVNKRRIN